MPKMIQQHNVVRGALLIIISELAMLTAGMLIKNVSSEVPTEQIVFIRNLIALFILIPWLIRKGLSHLHTKYLGLHISRSLVGLMAMACLFYSWGHLPLAQASLLKQTSPIFIPLFAYLWIKESIGVKTILAIIVGFIGVVLIINPGADNTQFNFVVLIAIISAMFSGLAKVIIRKMSPTEPAGRIVFYLTIIGTVVSAIPAMFSWVSLNWMQFVSLMGIAIFATIAQLTFSKAYSYAPAGQLGPYTYTSVAFAALLGWWIWDEELSWLVLLGITVIVAAGLLAVSDRHSSNKKIHPPTF